MQKTIHAKNYFYSNNEAITTNNFSCGVELTSNEIESISGGIMFSPRIVGTVAILEIAFLAATLENAREMLIHVAVGGLFYGVAAVAGVAAVRDANVANILTEKAFAVLTYCTISHIYFLFTGQLPITSAGSFYR